MRRPETGLDNPDNRGRSRDPLSRLGVQATLIDRYLDPNKTRFVHLADGGVSDNLGLRVAGGMMQNLAESSRAISALGLAHLRRILILSIDGEARRTRV